MKLESVKFGAQLAIGESPHDNGKYDVIHERLQLSDTEYVNLQGITDLQSITVECSPIMKRGFREYKYGIQQFLNVIAIKREVDRQEKWIFLCDSKDFFLTIANEFKLAYTLKATLHRLDTNDLLDEANETETKVSSGHAKPNAKSFVEEVFGFHDIIYNLTKTTKPSYDAHCAFLKYLLDAGKTEREASARDAFYQDKNLDYSSYYISGCEFRMPDDKKDFHPVIERCLICESWDFGNVYEFVSSFLPKNINMKVAWEIKQLRVDLGKNFEKKEDVLEKYRQFVASGDYIPEMKKIQQEIERWTKLTEDGIAEKGFGDEYLVFLQGKMKILENKVCEELKECDFNPKYEEDNKIKMLVWLISYKREDYDNAKNIYQEFYAREKRFQEMLRNSIESMGDLLISQYFMFYHFGRILIGSCFGKTKNNYKNISKEDLDCAMMYFYDTDTAQEAYKLKRYQEERKKGAAGEEKVDHALKWLEASGDYKSVHKKWSVKCLDKIIRLRNPSFINEPLEYDHILVGKKGVFVIETKNYKGKIIVDAYGNWVRDKNGESYEGEENPVQQVDRHVDLLKSFLKGIPVIGVICVAHRSAIIEGEENCPIPLVRSDKLERLIKDYSLGDKELTKAEMEECISLIESHRYQEEHVMSKWCFNYDTEKHEIIRCRRF